MKSNRAWILVGAALSTGLGVVFVLSDRHPKLRAGSRLLLVGDSLAVGLSPYLRAIAADEHVPFESVARVGTTIADWARSTPDHAALQQALDSFRPTVVLVSLGTNDEYLSSAALDAEHDDLDRLVAMLRPYDVGWVGVPSLPKPGSNGAVDLVRSTGLPYFASQRLDLERAPDGIHPTAAGYAKWAGLLWSWIA